MDMSVFSRSRLLLIAAIGGCVVWCSGEQVQARHGGSWGGGAAYHDGGGGSFGGAGRHQRKRHHRKHAGHGSFGRQAVVHQPVAVSHGSCGSVASYGAHHSGVYQDHEYQDQGYDAAPPAPPQQRGGQDIPDAPPAPPQGGARQQGDAGAARGEAAADRDAL
jgi:hypothetical protein